MAGRGGGKLRATRGRPVRGTRRRHPTLHTRHPALFSDTLLALERAHLLRLGAWGAACVLLGSALLAALAVRRAGSPLLRHFAIQTAAWGAIDLAFVALGWRGLRLRDYESAASLDRFLWLNLGLDVGYVAVGVTLAVCAWTLGRRLGGVGAGIGVVVQGLALLALDAAFARQLAAYV